MLRTTVISNDMEPLASEWRLMSREQDESHSRARSADTCVLPAPRWETRLQCFRCGVGGHVRRDYPQRNVPRRRDPNVGGEEAAKVQSTTMQVTSISSQRRPEPTGVMVQQRRPMVLEAPERQVITHEEYFYQGVNTQELNDLFPT
ncbi:unnamed protein product [Gordionus sp. m RMFG-2023]